VNTGADPFGTGRNGKPLPQKSAVGRENGKTLPSISWVWCDDGAAPAGATPGRDDYLARRDVQPTVKARIQPLAATACPVNVGALTSVQAAIR
jgi:hypothetical protein